MLDESTLSITLCHKLCKLLFKAFRPTKLTLAALVVPQGLGLLTSARPLHPHFCFYCLIANWFKFFLSLCVIYIYIFFKYMYIQIYI